MANNVLVAVGSRSEESARTVAEQYSSPPVPVRAHPSYGEFADDPDGHVIYVTTSHGRHHIDVLVIRVRQGGAGREGACSTSGA